jgi:hypothetical protein
MGSEKRIIPPLIEPSVSERGAFMGGCDYGVKSRSQGGRNGAKPGHPGK